MATLVYVLLMPRLARVAAGLQFAAGNFVRITGNVPAKLQAARLPGGSIGVHAADADGNVSLCGCSIVSATKDTMPLVADTATANSAKQRERVAAAVTCRFCLARLVKAGVITADGIGANVSADARAYALDYGTRDADAELAAIATRAAEAKAAIAAAEAEAKAAADKAARKAAREAKAAAKPAASKTRKAAAKPRKAARA